MPFLLWGHHPTFDRTSTREGSNRRDLLDREDADLKYTRFEKARIIGARALQISLGAPILVKAPEDIIDPITIALMEYEKGVIPMTVNREPPEPKSKA
jgi:DNA-directed RNA polymerase subunit K